MNSYPIHVQLEGRTCVVVGAGKIAERKAASLRASGARIRLVAPQATPALQRLAEEGAIEWLKESYQSRHLDGAFMVMACTDRRAVNASVARHAQARQMLTLCADDPQAGNFVSTGQISRGDLTVTVSTGGKSPTLAAVLRERLEAEFGPEWAELTEIIGEMREIVKTNPEEAGRKEAIRRALDDAEVHALLTAGKRLEAETRIRECLSSSSG